MFTVVTVRCLGLDKVLTIYIYQVSAIFVFTSIYQHLSIAYQMELATQLAEVKVVNS